MLKIYQTYTERERVNVGAFVKCPRKQLLPFQIKSEFEDFDIYLCNQQGDRFVINIPTSQYDTIDLEFLHVYEPGSVVLSCGCGTWCLEFEFVDKVLYSEWFEALDFSITTNTRDFRKLALPLVFSTLSARTSVYVYFMEGFVPAFQHLEKGTTSGTVKLYLSEVSTEISSEIEISGITATVEGDYIRYRIESTAEASVLIGGRYQLRITDGTKSIYSQTWGAAFVPIPFSEPPSIIVASALIPFLSAVGIPSTSQSYTVYGHNLQANLGVLAPSNFQISVNEVDWSVGMSLTPIGGEVEQIVFIRYNPTQIEDGSDTVEHSSLNATTKYVTVEFEATGVVYGLLYNWYAASMEGGNEGTELTNQYWLTDAAPAYDHPPAVEEPSSVWMNGVELTRGVYNALQPGEWDWSSELEIYLRVRGFDDENPNLMPYGYVVINKTLGKSIINPDEALIGWGIPTDAEFTTLATYLGGATVAGGKLKEMGLEHWATPNTGATNEVGFNGRGSDFRSDLGLFPTKNRRLDIWTSTEVDLTRAIKDRCNYDNSSFIRVPTGDGSLKKAGHSVRPIRPATVSEQANLSDGDYAGVYTGNNGKKYRTVKIGTQVWLADNLAETKYSDGSWITGFGVYNDWYLGSQAEMEEVKANLYDEGIGDFQNDVYWSSSQYSASQAWGVGMDGNVVEYDKDNTFYVRPIRHFTSKTVYALGDWGQAGHIFYITDLGGGSYKYYEAAPVTYETTKAWGLTTNNIAGTGTTIGTGEANTALIVAVETGKAANYCDGLSVTPTGNYKPISNADWAALTTEACCAYNNDLNNV